MPRWVWVAGTVLAALAASAPAVAQPLPPADPTPVRRTASAEPSILGAPVAVAGFPVRSTPEPTAAPPAPPAEPPRPARVALGAPSVVGGEPVGAVVPAGAAETVRTARPDAVPADPVNDFLARRAGPPEKDKAADPGRRTSGKFGDRIHDIIGDHDGWFCSDHAFDGFISPVTNPFLFEDPRSVTEARLIYFYQRIPGGQPDTGGGSVSYLGLQGRVAITNRLSFTISKFGGTWFSPSSDVVVPDSVGFSEIWLGPKFTFIRNEETGSLLAGGLQFQIPIGSGSVYQNTGSLSIVPYATYAQNFFCNAPLGGMNAMANVAYAFSTTDARSDYLSLSGHLDWDVMNWHRFYPLLELNYTLVTTNGTARPLVGSEGRDAFNLGGAAQGHGLLSGAIGARYKFTESAQIGAAYEIPLAGPRDFFNSRFTLDFILRY
ncbi:hypothetical protein [Urbifossiella limnaea]|uniref:Transporter n=1 Tax=Urbifossiella limnaea TaxID=2528023 RepID=A0A517XPC9_9BACT|nr:hypothetical protein [Urbifossiella limnaea]QDU19370.1 hypothetical protein ETAA1_12940 [Urbifossiella limnaea]